MVDEIGLRFLTCVSQFALHINTKRFYGSCLRYRQVVYSNQLAFIDPISSIYKINKICFLAIMNSLFWQNQSENLSNTPSVFLSTESFLALNEIKSAARTIIFRLLHLLQFSYISLPIDIYTICSLRLSCSLHFHNTCVENKFLCSQFLTPLFSLN